MVGKFDTVIGDGPQFPHQLGSSIPFLETVLNFPTGGEIRYRFSKRSSISPPVGKFGTVFQDGPQFPHQWGNSVPFFKTVLNFPTRGEIVNRLEKRYRISPRILFDEPFYTPGGEIENRFLRRSSISPLVGKLRTDQRNGSQFPH